MSSQRFSLWYLSSLAAEIDHCRFEGEIPQPPGGVTRNLDLTYLRPLPVPSTVKIKSEVVQDGGSNAMSVGRIMSMDEKKVYVLTQHHKVKIKPNL